MLLLLACARPPVPAAAPDPVEAWLEAHRIPLDSVDPTADPAALEPLGSILAERRVVALGESTHGTGELFRVKDRLVRWLASDHGFTILALEIPYDTGLRLDDWIHGGPGDAVDLLRGTWWWLDADEIVDLVTWLRDHARSHPITIVGVDPQCADRSAAALVAAGVGDRATSEVLAAVAARREAEIPDLDAAAARLEALELEPRLAGHLAIVAEAVNLMRFCRRGADAGCESAGRDAYLAENVARALARDPTARAVVWAHDDHVAHLAHPDGWSSMGEVLRGSLPAGGLYSVALEVGRGDFVAPAGGPGAVDLRAIPELRGFEVATYPVPPEPLADRLAEVPDPPWFLDLTDLADAPPEVRALFEEGRLHDLGAAPPGGPSSTVDPVAAGWDGLLFVREGHAFRPSGRPRPSP